jgi:predicted kinase
MSSPSNRVTRSEPLHQQVARSVRNDIDAGVLRDGDVLPSTRELAQHWGVSVFTINEAMKILIDEGLVVSKSRSKRTVVAPVGAARAEVRLPSPQVLLIGGYAGSGKTELGRMLARETGWPILDKDTLTRPVVEAALEILGQPPNDRESETYIERVRPREYEALMAASDENVQCGNSVIVTAPFLREFADVAWINRALAGNREMNATTSLVWVYCDEDSMHTYVRRRGAARDAAKLADWPAYLRTIDTTFRPAAAHLVMDNGASGLPLRSQARDLLKEIVNG